MQNEIDTDRNDVIVVLSFRNNCLKFNVEEAREFKRKNNASSKRVPDEDVWALWGDKECPGTYEVGIDKHEFI